MCGSSEAAAGRRAYPAAEMYTCWRTSRRGASKHEADPHAPPQVRHCLCGSGGQQSSSYCMSGIKGAAVGQQSLSCFVSCSMSGSSEAAVRQQSSSHSMCGSSGAAVFVLQHAAAAVWQQWAAGPTLKLRCTHAGTWGPKAAGALPGTEPAPAVGVPDAAPLQVRPFCHRLCGSSGAAVFAILHAWQQWGNSWAAVCVMLHRVGQQWGSSLAAVSIILHARQ